MNAKDLRIVFMGTPEFAVPSLRALVRSGYNVVGVVTTPDKPAGRGQKLHESDVKIAARELGLPILQPEKLRDPAFVSAMEELRPDLGIVIAFRMLPEVVWAMPRLGTFNLHASLLPQYRGAAPINWAIINGESKTGVTTFLLNHEIDKGAILGQVEMPIQPEDNVGTLYDRLMTVGADLVVQTVERQIVGLIKAGADLGVGGEARPGTGRPQRAEQILPQAGQQHSLPAQIRENWKETQYLLILMHFADRNILQSFCRNIRIWTS